MKEALNLKTYLKYYDKFSFLDQPFNEVDNVILSMLSYVDFRGIVSLGTKISIQEAWEEFDRLHPANEMKKQVKAIRSAVELFSNLSTCHRYSNLLLTDYVYEVEAKSQFGALTILLPDNTMFVSFEGTDGQVSGWEEDFRISYEFPVPAQEKAITYLNHIIRKFHRVTRVGGHSKGGNLALVAAMYANPLIRRRIKHVYNNDGPGLREKEYQSRSFQRVQKKLTMIVPQDSLVGMLFCHPENYIIVKTTVRGIFSHDGTTWCCYGAGFLQTEQSASSKKKERALSSWLEKMDDARRKEITGILSALFTKSGVTDINELRPSKLNNVLKLISEIKNMNNETRRQLTDAIELLFEEIK